MRRALVGATFWKHHSPLSEWRMLVGAAPSLPLPFFFKVVARTQRHCSFLANGHLGVWVGCVALVELGCCVIPSGVQPLVVLLLFVCSLLACVYDVVLQWYSNSGVDTLSVWGWECECMPCHCVQRWWGRFSNAPQRFLKGVLGLPCVGCVHRPPS